MNNRRRLLPPLEVLNEYFTYSVITGRLYHNKERGVRKKGSLAEVPQGKRHLFVYVKRERYAAHRVIWYMVTGKQPPLDLVVEHDDSNGSNNTWLNLCLRTNSQNVTKKTTSENHHIEVYKRKSDSELRFLVRLTTAGVRHTVGYYKTLEEAKEARDIFLKEALKPIS